MAESLGLLSPAKRPDVLLELLFACEKFEEEVAKGEEDER